MSYSYDRTAAESPANVLRNTGRALHTIDRDLGHSEASLKGLLNQLTMMVRSTHDKNVRSNYEMVRDITGRFEQLHKDAKNLAVLFDEGSREYR